MYYEGRFQLTWTVRKLAFAGIVAAVMFVFWAAAQFIVVVGQGFDPGGAVATRRGSLIFFFVVPMLSVLAARVLDEKGAMVLPAFVLSLLLLPLPGWGAPGFLPKIAILVVPFIVAELLYLLLRKRPGAASITSGALAGFLIAFSLVNVLGANVFFGTNFDQAYYLVGAVEGGVGGLVGHGIYTKIRDRSAIQRLQQDGR